MCALGARAWCWLSLAAATSAGLLPCGAHGAEPGAPWKANEISVIETTPGHEASVSSRFEVGNNGDARVTVTLHDAAHTRGTIVLIAGRWLLTQGFAATPGSEIRAMDVAALNSQLVILLLSAALPQGPPAAGAPQHVSVTEKNNPIRIATETASAEYNPPWTVDGTVGVSSPDAPVAYHLSFTWSASGHETTRVFSGTVANTGPAVSFPDSMKLAGWSVREISAHQQAAPAGGAGSGGAMTSPKVATLGELRRLP